MKNNKFVITDIFGEKVELTAALLLYEVRDYMGNKKVLFGIQLYSEDGPYATLTVSFGEFIGMPNAMYVDTNNCYFADQLLTTGIAKEAGLWKNSGYCSYPLWLFDAEFLETIGGADYQRYIQQYSILEDEYDADDEDEEFE